MIAIRNKVFKFYTNSNLYRLDNKIEFGNMVDPFTSWHSMMIRTEIDEISIPSIKKTSNALPKEVVLWHQIIQYKFLEFPSVWNPNNRIREIHCENQYEPLTSY